MEKMIKCFIILGFAIALRFFFKSMLHKNMIIILLKKIVFFIAKRKFISFKKSIVFFLKDKVICCNKQILYLYLRTRSFSLQHLFLNNLFWVLILLIIVRSYQYKLNIAKKKIKK